MRPNDKMDGVENAREREIDGHRELGRRDQPMRKQLTLFLSLSLSLPAAGAFIAYYK